ncbi:MAG: methyltransferase domain-containing protein [Pseudomonadota bacterium]
MSAALPLLHDPVSGTALDWESAHVLAGAGTRYPVIDGIAYLRAGRDALRTAALDQIDRGDLPAARRLLLADRDDHAKGPPPDPDALARLGSGEIATLREAMAALGFGPVADYFAHRWSAPTFVSALGLLSAYWREDQGLIEIGCGIGQILREAQALGQAVIGIDVVFSKLWLARRFVLGGEAALLCADAERAPVLAPPSGASSGACVLCHDALYFLRDKAAVLATMRALAGAEGTVLVGHAHNASVDQRGVGGWPLVPADWAALMPQATLYDDRACAEAWIAGRTPAPARLASLDKAEALCLAEGTPNALPRPIGTTGAQRYRLNPLLGETTSGTLAPHWPSEALAREYAHAPYLHQSHPPAPETVAAAEAGLLTPAVRALVRKRVLIDLPEAW